MTHPCRYTDDSSYDYSDYFEGKGYYAQTHDDDDDDDDEGFYVGGIDTSNTYDEKTAIDRHENQQTDGKERGFRR
jgi:hypothetical protein